MERTYSFDGGIPQKDEEKWKEIIIVTSNFDHIIILKNVYSQYHQYVN